MISSLLSKDGYTTGSSSSSEAAAQAALFAGLATLKCETGFFAVQMTGIESTAVVIGLSCYMVVLSVVSAWFSRRREVMGPKLLLFFTHWLSGLLYMMALFVELIMITLCWASEDVLGFVKCLKFFELTASNLLAITNLAITVSLARVVMSHRTMSVVEKADQRMMTLMYLLISAAAASVSIPFWETMMITSTSFWPLNSSKSGENWIAISYIFVELIVGVCLLITVTSLLFFWTTEVKECWKAHSRIRYYFCLTLIGTAVNLGIGVCGLINIFSRHKERDLVVATWGLRNVHIALDTFVLYGVLGTSFNNDRSARSASFSGGRPASGIQSSTATKATFEREGDRTDQISSNGSMA